MSDFEKSVEIVRYYEGDKYTNHPNDPGGPTKYGVTLADVKRFIDPRATATTVRNLTWDQAKEVYRKHYWLPLRCDELSFPVNFLLFDFGVNAGLRQSVKTAQRCIGVTADGVLGPITLAALQKVDGQEFNNAFAQRRLAFYRSLTKLWPTFGRGWRNRVLHAQNYAAGKVKL